MSQKCYLRFIGLKIENSLPRHVAAMFFSGDKRRENQRELGVSSEVSTDHCILT